MNYHGTVSITHVTTIEHAFKVQHEPEVYCTKCGSQSVHLFECEQPLHWFWCCVECYAVITLPSEPARIHRELVDKLKVPEVVE